MFQSVTVKSIAAVAAAALVAGVVAFLTSAMPPAMAGPQVEGAVVHQPPAKGDRGPLLVTGSACSSRSWPNYDLNCQFDTRRSANEAPTIRRVIALR